MHIIAGLGNPGSKYKNTPHNMGFETIDQLQENWKTVYKFTDWKFLRKFDSEISEGTISDKKIILAKPITYMNDSGIAVKKIFNFYKMPYGNIIIIHDDFDLPWGDVKISRDRGSAGHKGVGSIITTLGTKNFTRIRIGVKPADATLPSKSLDKFVLNKFTTARRKEVQNIAAKTIDEVKKIIG